MPATQLVHAADVTSPVVGEKVPAAQLVHADVPELGEKVPAAQLVHSDVPEEYFPAAQLGKCEG